MQQYKSNSRHFKTNFKNQWSCEESWALHLLCPWGYFNVVIRQRSLFTLSSSLSLFFGRCKALIIFAYVADVIRYAFKVFDVLVTIKTTVRHACDNYRPIALPPTNLSLVHTHTHTHTHTLYTHCKNTLDTLSHTHGHTTYRHIMSPMWSSNLDVKMFGVMIGTER